MTEHVTVSTEAAMKRKLTVILASDVAGYSRLVAEHEEETIERFHRAAQVFSDLVRKYDGRVFNNAGDAILAEFNSAVSAVRCAIDIQEATRSQNRDYRADKRLLFRIGIAIGDVVVVADGDLLGDGVNIAARLQTLTEPGCICISQEVQNHVSNKIALRFVDLGAHVLKNIPHPVRAYRLVPGPIDDRAPAKAAFPSIESRSVRLMVLGLLGLAIGAIALFSVYVVKFQSPAATEATAARRFDASQIPFAPETARQRIAKLYMPAGNHKALAVSGDTYGVAIEEPSEQAARAKALEDCTHRSRAPCSLYAVGLNVVWSKVIPMPMAAEIRGKPIDAEFRASDVPSLPEPARERLATTYQNAPKPKALALSPTGGYWFQGALYPDSSRAEVSRIALERCGDLAGAPCLLYAIDDLLTVRIPVTRKVTNIFTLAGDTKISSREKQRLIEIYQGAEWRALAFGGKGTWHAEAGAATEAEAVEAVLAKCAKSDSNCRLYAIGSFLVEDTGH